MLCGNLQGRLIVDTQQCFIITIQKLTLNLYQLCYSLHMNYWESKSYFSLLTKRINYLMKQQQDDNKLMIIKKAKIYFIYKVLRKLLQIKTHTDLLFLVDKSIGKSDNLKILDIGGGVGENYFELLPINLKEVSFYVSDSYQLFKQGHKFRYNNIRSEDKIIYTGKISKHKFQFDLLLLNGSIQYLKDIAIIINQLAKKPKNIIIDRTLFSNNSFAAMQTNKGGYTTRYEIFLESRLIIKIESLGYEFSQGGSKRKHKIKFDVGTIDGYYKAMHFRIKSKQ